MPDTMDARHRMVEKQLAARGVRDPGVLAAMRAVPRELFLDPGLEEFAYEDAALPLGAGRMLHWPYLVALMLEAAELDAGDRVLELGEGAGYLAALLDQLACQVYAQVATPEQWQAAHWRLARLDLRAGIELRQADPASGWAEHAPYDAILVAPDTPVQLPVLREQLAPGGRLILPLGEHAGLQLRRIRRIDGMRFEEDAVAAVAFAPLPDRAGRDEDGTRAASNHVPGRVRGRTPAQLIAQAAEPLPELDDPAFATAFDRFASCRVVLLGECSHGTSEFYRARDAITRRLIGRHGFCCVAVEADWPDAAAVNRYVRQRPPRVAAEPAFQRFPTWMWRNAEVEALVRWLRGHNAPRDPLRRAGFYGLDLYNLSGSIGAVLEYLDRTDPEAARVARQRYGCLTPWQKSPATYGRAVLTHGYRSCEPVVVQQCRELLGQCLARHEDPEERWLDAAQNARLVASAERYYRVMYYGGAESWNLRDTHMFETLEQLLAAQGEDARIVVWAHNSHIGDARATDMGQLRGELNLGQLCRGKFGRDAALIGFGTHTGEVAAASDWDEPMEVMRVRPSRADSIERMCHDAGVPRYLLDLRDGSLEPALRRALEGSLLERFIGVIYRPDTELQSHYASVSLPHQFDAYVWFDETTAVTPLGPQHAAAGTPETWPFGV